MNPAVLADLGAHVSAAGGLQHTFARADAIGARTMQIFLKNQRQWRPRPLGDFEVGAFRQARAQSGVRAVVAHATYLINLASEDEALWRRSIDCLAEELRRAVELELLGVVVHPGASELGTDRGCARIARALEQIDADPRTHGTLILLEQVAGQGHAIGARLEELAAVLAELDPATAERVGICIDTCHMFAAGYDIATPRGFAETLAALDETVGLGRIGAIHLNDSVGARGSRLDRHAHIGQGRIGLDGFLPLLAEPRLLGIPKVLETSHEDEGHRRDLERLRALVAAHVQTAEPPGACAAEGR